MATWMRRLALAMVTVLPMACTMAPGATRDQVPVMRWDHRPEAEIWTTRALASVERHDDDLTELVPADIAAWCPGYVKADETDRRAFWVGILSALAKHESTWNPAASGGGGRWIGLTQIAPGTARAFGCEATSAGALKDGGANLSCAVRIAAVQVGRDGLVAGNGRQGLGRDWAPFRSADKRAEMAAWTRGQSYCQG